MSTYVLLINWTAKGIEQVKDSPARADKARALAKSLGGEMKQIFLTMGKYDLVAIVEMPDDATMARFALTASSGGHIRTTTLSAFDEAAYRKIVKSV